MKKSGKLLRWFLKALTALLSLALMAAVGFLLVLAQPKADDRETPVSQPLLTASPAFSISS